MMEIVFYFHGKIITHLTVSAFLYQSTEFYLTVYVCMYQTGNLLYCMLIFNRLINSCLRHWNIILCTYTLREDHDN